MTFINHFQHFQPCSQCLFSRHQLIHSSQTPYKDHVVTNIFSSVQLLSRVRLSVNPWTAALQDSLSITSSWSLLKLMSIELVMPSNHLILCHPLLSCFQSFPASGFFPMSQFFASGGQSIRVSISTSVLPLSIKD